MRRISIISTVVAAHFCACSQGADVAAGFVYTEADFPSCHAATIVEYPQGYLTAAFFGGSYEGADDVCIYMCRKPVSGGRWSAPVKVAEDSLYACWNPVLFDNGGELTLFYKTGPEVRKWRGHCKVSRDGGETWEEPYDYGDDMFGAIKNKPVRLASGRIVCPSSDERDGWRIHFELSDDGGHTWMKSGPVEADDTVSVIQPSILTCRDGSLLAVCRSRNGRVAVTRSADGGLTWSRVEFIDFPQNNSGLDAVTLPDGRFAMVCNPVGNNPGEQVGPRTPLCVMVSEDGENWTTAAVLEDGEGEYSYPSVIYGSDGALHIVYTWRRQRIKYARVRSADHLFRKRMSFGVENIFIK